MVTVVAVVEMVATAVAASAGAALVATEVGVGWSRQRPLCRRALSKSHRETAAQPSPAHALPLLASRRSHGVDPSRAANRVHPLTGRLLHETAHPSRHKSDCSSVRASAVQTRPDTSNQLSPGNAAYLIPPQSGVCGPVRGQRAGLVQRHRPDCAATPGRRRP